MTGRTKRGIIVFIIIAAAILLAKGTSAASCIPQQGHAGCFVNLGGQDLSDYDCDCVPDILDNCPDAFNPYQEDTDHDGIGDACGAVGNDPPVLALQDLPLSCGGADSIDLRDYVRDEHVQSVTFMKVGNSDTSVVAASVSGSVATFTSQGANGYSDVTFRATDDGGLSSEDTVRVSVSDCHQNRPPRFDTELQGQPVLCDGSFSPVDLRDYVSDPDNAFSDLQFSVSGANRIGASVQNGVLRLTNPHEDVSERITVTARDPAGLSDASSATFSVSGCVHNTPPVWSSFTIPQVSCQGSTTVNVLPYVSDDHTSDANLILSGESDEPDVRVTQVSHGSFKIQHVGTSSTSATITFTAEDEGGLSARTTKSVSITCNPTNNPPVFRLQDLDLSCTDSATVNLRDYVDDEHVQSLAFALVRNQNPSVVAVSMSGALARFVSQGVNGGSGVTFRATDDQGLTGDGIMHVQVSDCTTNQPPRFTTELPGQSITCDGSFSSVDLRNYVADPDNAFSDLQFSVSGNSRIGATVQNGILRLTNPGVNVGESITVTARDPAGLTDSSTATFTVSGCGGTNNPPTLNVPDQSLSCNQDKAINIRNYASDEDVSSITFSVISVDPSGIVSTSLSGANLHLTSLGQDGTATIRMGVTDDQGLSGSDSFHVTVSGCTLPPGNEPPRFTADVPGQTVQCDDSFDTINLRDLVADPDDSISSLRFSASGNDHIGVSISEDGVAHLSNPHQDVSEAVTFRVTDQHGASDTSTATFRVKGCGKEPAEKITLSGIPDQSVCYGDRFDAFDLDRYVDHAQGNVDFSVSNEGDLDVHIDSSGRVTVDYTSGYVDRQTVRFKVKDEDGKTASGTATFSVKDCGDGHQDRYIHDGRIDILPPPIPTVRFVEFKPEPEPKTQCMVVDRLTRRTLPDWDCDQVPDDRDNCPRTANFNQKDSNGNNIGDACDMSLESFSLAPSSIQACDDATVSAVIRNKLGQDMEDISVRVTIEELGIIATEDMGSLKDGESDDVSLTLHVPEGVPAKDYIVKFTAEYSGRDAVYTSARLNVASGSCSASVGDNNVVDVYNIQDVPPGGAAVFPLKITNPDSAAKSYTVRLVGVSGWGSYSLDSGSVVVVPPFGKRTVNAYVSANEDAGPGERSFMAEIKAGGEVEQVVLVADVKAGEGKSNTALAIIVLEYVLAALVIIAAVLAVSYAVQKRRVQKVIASS